MNDADGAAARAAAPVTVRVDLAKLPVGKAKAASLRLVEVGKGTDRDGKSVPTQFEPDTARLHVAEPCGG